MASDLPAHDTLSNAAHAAPANRRDPWRSAWRIATSDELLAMALLGVAALLLLAAWLPQSPAGDDLATYSRWLALVQSRFGPASSTLKTLGLFSISDTLLWRALIGLIGCALAARLVDYVEAAWINRFPLAAIPRLMAVTGALILLLGLALTAIGGWRSRDVLLGIGEMALIGPDTPYTLRLDSLPESGSGQVTLLQETEPVATGLIAPGRALDAAGLSVHFQDAGPAMRVSATLGEGPLNLLASATASRVSELLLRFTPGETEHIFAAPDAGLWGRISFSPPSHSFHVLLYRTHTGAIVFEGEVPSEGILRLDNVTLKLAPERYARLIVTRDPGAWPTAAGWLIGTLGLGGGWAVSLRRMWSRAAEKGPPEGTSAAWRPEETEE